MRLAIVGGSREAELLTKAVEKLGVEIDPSAELVVIAPHPFDTDLIECAMLSAKGKPHILLQRPKWLPEPADNWHFANSASIAAQILESLKVRHALLAVGNGRLAPFYRLENIELMVRSRNTPHPPAPPMGKICPFFGPFNVETELKSLAENNIDALVVHNAGGQGGWPKLAAARQLGLPVVLIDRPDLPDIKTVTNVDAALEWIAASLGLDLCGQSA
ncbi:MAG: precorrin-6A/cobalt-precorrin-6A reductase [Rhodobacteraceae bacterium]|nr:precorrin-6A/cobalt-precorrin-6A reductase [Paracoccaceae bacterium]